MKYAGLLFFIMLITLAACDKKAENNENLKDAPAVDSVRTGADILLTDSLHLIEGKSIGLITNHTALLRDGSHLADRINALDNVNLKALFGPEHGIRGSESAGASIESGIDSKTGVPVFSLYGKTKKPTAEMLKGIDLLIFDIQDIGARFYTYISTLYYVLEAGAGNGIPVLVLDRPNPIGGLKVDGPVRKEGLFSFVGIAPIPIMHGMTVGELAKLFAGENYFNTDTKPLLTVLDMENWKRDLYFDECNLPWIKPSPNMPTLETALIYPGTCLLEGTNVSEGRGTEKPFLTLGAPFINKDALVKMLDSLGHKGAVVKELDFTPEGIEGVAPNPKYKNELCSGITVSITDRDAFQPVQFGIKLIYALRMLHPDFTFKDRWFDLLSGDTEVRKLLEEGAAPQRVIESWEDDLNRFFQVRKKYLTY